MRFIKDYEAVIGLEVHIELKTESKMFCGCKVAFGMKPNSCCCPVCTGMPGAMPALNKNAVEKAITAGLTAYCDISNVVKLDRKNYFYPDLPKGYQISQLDTPLCKNGFLDIEADGYKKRIGITQIHIEEDAGKLIHSMEHGTLIDCNRCGVPLIEVVTAPDFRTDVEVVAFLKKLRENMVFAGVSDCKMNEGAFRCDVNLSVRKKGMDTLGVRTETKNINSFSFVSNAIKYEYERQVEALENNEIIERETRRFDEISGKTHVMRKKENVCDYRFVYEPDLPSYTISEAYIDGIAKEIPLLPDERRQRYMLVYALNEYDASLLTTERQVSDFFDTAVSKTFYPKLLANLIVADMEFVSNHFDNLSSLPAYFAQLANLLGNDLINSSTAKKAINAIHNGEEPIKYIESNKLFQINDRERIKEISLDVISKNTKMVCDYKSGKKAALKSIVGAVMAETKGNVNPKILNRILDEIL